MSCSSGIVEAIIVNIEIFDFDFHHKQGFQNVITFLSPLIFIYSLF